MKWLDEDVPEQAYLHWIYVEFETGRTLQILDDHLSLNDSSYIGKKIEILFSASVYHASLSEPISKNRDLTHQVILGHFIGRYEISEVWKEKAIWYKPGVGLDAYEFYRSKGLAFEIKEGIFYLGEGYPKGYKTFTKVGKMRVRLGRCDILSW